jgi:hypothetical protein
MIFVLLLSSCISERFEWDNDEDNATERMISFTVRVPGMAASRTRMMSEQDEKHIETIDILLFKNDGGAIEYVYTPFPVRTFENPNSDMVTFTTLLPEGIYDVVLFANARSIISNVVANNNIVAGMPKADVLKQLVFENTGLWNTGASGGTFTPVPMWAEMTGFKIDTESAAPQSHQTNFVRMVAKIDVQIASIVDNFQLTSVHLYNLNNRGQIAPNNAAPWNIPSMTNPKPPSIPESEPLSIAVGATKSTTPVTFDTQIVGNQLLNSIYIFETTPGTYNTLSENTFIIIGGKWGREIGGTIVFDEEDTYYRIEFANEDDHLPLRRNHRYVVHINEVGSRGYRTQSAAITSPINNIKSTTVEFNDGRFTHLALMNRIILASSDSNIELPTTASEYNVLIFTNNTDGWTITGITDASGAPVSWLNTSTETTVTDANGQVTPLRLQANSNTGGDWRTAHIHLMAGRLSLILRLDQVGTLQFSEGHGGWAGSNIYWVSTGTHSGRFAFDDVDATANQARQGVYFRWGSLIARSAASGAWAGTTRLYFPSGQTGTASALSMPTWGLWSSVLETLAADSHRAYLYEITDGRAGVGDICKFMTEMGWAPPGRNWRMPVAAEFGSIDDYTVTTATGWNVLDNTNEAGIALIQSGANPIGWRKAAMTATVTQPAHSETLFPAAGFAGATHGSTNNPTSGTATHNSIRTSGIYWSSSPTASGGATTGTAYGLQIGDIGATTAKNGATIIVPQATIDRRHAAPIRCVVDLR